MDMNEELPLETNGPAESPAPVEPEQPESERKLVAVIQQRVKSDKDHHEDAFKQMRADMFLARFGHEKEYPKESYSVALAGRHVKVKTAALYAKNPKAVARRRETLDFAVWDEDPASLTMAFQTLAEAQAMMAQAPMIVDEMTGQAAIDPAAITPEMQMAFDKARETIADYQEGMQLRQFANKLGRTLETLFSHALREQKPLDFKTSMKQCVRRACTTGVGYVELGFQRETGPRPEMSEKLADARSRLDHLRRLVEEVADGTITEDDPEIMELQMSVAALQAEPEIVLREGLVMDFPQSTRVIPDKLTRELVGFVGSRHLTIEYLFTTDQVKEMFKVDLGKNYRGYTTKGGATEETSSANIVSDDDDADDVQTPTGTGNGEGLVCVWKHYDKTSGLVYLVADGYPHFLKPPAAPDVFVEDFWPVYALTFNAVEDEERLFPPSDVYLLRHQNSEVNRSRQGKREHRHAARPRYVYANGAFDDDDLNVLATMKPFEAKALNMAPETKIGDILQTVPISGVDPNLYDTGEVMSDAQMAVGTQEAQLGGIAKATATESAIAAGSSASSDGSSVDDLDAFLTVLARASGQIFLREMSPETVMRVAGRGAVWPEMTLADVSEEIFLEVEAGSSGKPNQAVEVQKFKELAPLIMQIPNIKSERLAREAIRRLDDRLDLSEFIETGLPSIVSANRMPMGGGAGQPAPDDPNADPAAQGGEGGNNGPQPPGQTGSGPAFGSNQV